MGKKQEKLKAEMAELARKLFVVGAPVGLQDGWVVPVGGAQTIPIGLVAAAPDVQNHKVSVSMLARPEQVEGFYYNPAHLEGQDEDIEMLWAEAGKAAKRGE